MTTDGDNRAPNRAMLRAVGFTDEDFHKPMIGIASTWSEVTPCNIHINKLAEKVKEGVRTAGGVPQIYGTITVSDGITMGHEGMHFSLPSREVIADSIEIVSNAMRHDGVIAIGGCDKNMPGCLMALCRIDAPSIFVYGEPFFRGIATVRTWISFPSSKLLVNLMQVKFQEKNSFESSRTRVLAQEVVGGCIPQIRCPPR